MAGIGNGGSDDPAHPLIDMAVRTAAHALARSIEDMSGYAKYLLDIGGGIQREPELTVKLPARLHDSSVDVWLHNSTEVLRAAREQALVEDQGSITTESACAAACSRSYRAGAMTARVGGIRLELQVHSRIHGMKHAASVGVKAGLSTSGSASAGYALVPGNGVDAASACLEMDGDCAVLGLVVAQR